MAPATKPSELSAKAALTVASISRLPRKVTPTRLAIPCVTSAAKLHPQPSCGLLHTAACQQSMTCESNHNRIRTQSNSWRYVHLIMMLKIRLHITANVLNDMMLIKQNLYPSSRQQCSSTQPAYTSMTGCLTSAMAPTF